MIEKMVPVAGIEPATFGLQNPWLGSGHGGNARFSVLSLPIWAAGFGPLEAQKAHCAPRSNSCAVSRTCGARLSAHPDQVVEG